MPFSNSFQDMDQATELLYAMLCEIWYHLCNLKTVKNAHRGVLLSVQLQALATVEF